MLSRMCLTGLWMLASMLTFLSSVEAFAPSLQLVQGGALPNAMRPKTAGRVWGLRSSNVANLLMQSDDSSETSPLKLPSPEKVTQNMKEGSVGERGEIFVALQFLFVFLVFIAPVFEETLEGIGLVMGLAICAAGISLGALGVMDLGDSLTPWPKPTSSNQLQTTGSYSLARHPIYGGLLISCFGLSMLTVSFPRLFFTAILFVVLDLKSDLEEKWLSDVHPEYGKYKDEVPKLFPTNPTQALNLVQSIIKSLS